TVVRSTKWRSSDTSGWWREISPFRSQAPSSRYNALCLSFRSQAPSCRNGRVQNGKLSVIHNLEIVWVELTSYLSTSSSNSPAKQAAPALREYVAAICWLVPCSAPAWAFDRKASSAVAIAVASCSGALVAPPISRSKAAVSPSASTNAKIGAP